MNQFCKTFFTLFFTGIITAMLLLSYGLVCSLHDLADTPAHPFEVGTLSHIDDIGYHFDIM